MITDAQRAAAQAVQHAAAHDTSTHVRLVAGPGTGKSFAIEERVCWLIENSVPAQAIWAVSFTRASSQDLRRRIHGHAEEEGHSAVADVRVTTLHSLALRILRRANQLAMYPVEPMVLDQWELENIFDAEFGHVYDLGKERREDIRRHNEAYWSTGAWTPPNHNPPVPPITDEERSNFTAFREPRCQMYACVLPGEIIRLCVDRMDAGVLDAVELLGLQYLIVDEFQDLNPYDLKFIDHMIQKGVQVFVAGDDDQSVYSFRFASPEGITHFPANHPGCGQHELSDCFRCPPRVVEAATRLITTYPGQNRINKTLRALYGEAVPPVHGTVLRWRFTSGAREAKAVAASCKSLIQSGLNPRDILILLSNQNALARPLIDELESAEVPAEHPREGIFLDTNTGRLALAILRVVCDPDDYISLRAILGQRRGVGMGRCNTVAEAVMAGGLNFRSIFYDPLPDGAFTGQAAGTLNRARTTCSAMAGWQPTDTLEQRTEHVAAIIQEHYNDAEAGEWRTFIQNLPPGMTLEEVRDFLWAETDEQQNGVLEAAFGRLNMDIPEQGVLPPRVRIMTMHGAKGLSARVVFIIGLEEQIFPGPRRNPFPGLVQEAARLLYVSITRAQAACILSYAHGRLMQGTWAAHTNSRFAVYLAGPFTPRESGLTPEEVSQIMTDNANLFPSPPLPIPSEPT